MPDYFPFDPNPRRPSRAPPSNACDSQFHVFGSPDKYPVRPGAAYEMPSATFELGRRMHRQLGIERGIIVQPTTYGADHQAMLDALAEAGPNYRGCANAIVLTERDDAYIEKLRMRGSAVHVSRARVWASDSRPISSTACWAGSAISDGMPRCSRCRRHRRQRGDVRQDAGSAGAGRSHGPAGSSRRHERSESGAAARIAQARQFLGDAFAQ